MNKKNEELFDYKEWEELYWDANMFDGHDVKRICNGKAFISPGISQGGSM